MAANTFAVTGHAENKQITELLPGILNQVCYAKWSSHDIDIVLDDFVHLIVNPVMLIVVGC